MCISLTLVEGMKHRSLPRMRLSLLVVPETPRPQNPSL